LLGKGEIFGNPYIGVFCASNEFLGLVPLTASDELAESIGRCLGVENAVRTTMDGCNTIGALIRMNSNGAIMSMFSQEEEVERLGESLKAFRLRHKLNAVGNNILANDNGALVHPFYEDKTLEIISEILGVPVERGTVAGFKTVGSAAVATNKGAICHPHTGSLEMEQLERVLGVPVSISTANYGTGQLGACMIANTKGAVVGETSTPIELGKIEEGLRLY
jgi:translation initiation factor 6